MMKNRRVKIRDFVYRIPLVQQLGFQLIIGLIISLACLGGFAAITEDVLEQERIVEVDLSIANALHEAATPISTSIYKIISWAGMPGLWTLSIIVGLLFIRRKQRLHLAILVIGLVGGVLLNNLLKLLVARQRPTFINPFVIEQNFSFPSGHAMMSFIGYGLFAYFIWNSIANRYWRIVLIFAVSLLVILIGISRMTLGAHYLSDVVAGFAAGGVWLTACIIGIESIERRKREAVRQKAFAPTR
jgi:membrane-associated phospholipid phosphatase